MSGSEIANAGAERPSSDRPRAALLLLLVALAAPVPGRAGDARPASGAAAPPRWSVSAGPHVTCVRGEPTRCAGEDAFQLPEETGWLGAALEPSFGLRHGCALDGDGRAVCWGDGSQGQLGRLWAPPGSARGGTPERRKPGPVPGLPPLATLDVGWLHACGIDRAGSVLCWGADALGQLGRSAPGPAPQPVAGLERVARSLSAGGYHTCALLDGGGVSCWGDGSMGQLGQGEKADAGAPVAVVGLGGSATGVSAGAYHTCARLEGGGVRCWGDNRFGQLGDGTRTSSAIPVEVAGLAGPVRAVVAGFSFSCALLAEGTVQCWGSNELGELGAGAPEIPGSAGQAAASPPRRVEGVGEGVVALVAAGNHACAQGRDGAVFCWGSNVWGQLGDGGVAPRARPTLWRGEQGARPRPTLAPVASSGGAVQGLDVSYHSGRVDWRAAVARGDRFGLTLATAGVDFFDPFFFDHWEGMRQAGLVRGAYHFFVADDDPEQQARHFLAHVLFEPGDLLPVVDIESRKKPVPDLPARLARFLAVVERATGARPILYTGPTFWRNNMTADFGDYPLWIAEYGVEAPQVPPGWRQWHLWQWRGDVDLPAIAPIVDLNRLHPDVDLRRLLVPAPAAGSGAADPAPPAPVPVDHHVHLLGPGLLRDWKAIGARFSRADAAYLEPDRLLEGGDGAPPRAERVVLVPMAHLYGNSEFRGALGLSAEEEYARARAENDHVARAAALRPGRAVAFCSISVLRPWAWDEIRRCHSELRVAGLKLHLASSEVDLRQAADLERVAAIAAWAEREGVPLLIHLDTQRRGTEAADVERFARVVLEPHPRLIAAIAHLGGSGGYGPWTRSVFRTLLDWLEARERAGDRRPDLRFDVSAVILEEASEGVPPTTAEEAAALAADLRRAGLARLLVGSDYPVFDPVRTLELLGERAGLTPDELRALRANRLPELFAD